MWNLKQALSMIVPLYMTVGFFCHSEMLVNMSMSTWNVSGIGYVMWHGSSLLWGWVLKDISLSNIYLMEYVPLFNLVLLHCHVWVQEGKHESFRLLASECLGLRTAEPSRAKQPSVIRNCPSTRQYDQYAKECIHLWLNPCLSLFNIVYPFYSVLLCQTKPNN